jgi:hypothetical protein
MDHKEDKDIFLHHKNEIIQEYGKDALNTEDCNMIGKKYFKSHWGGCLPWNKVHLAPNKYYVINTSSSGHPGIHWMGLMTHNKHAYLWDSYNRSIKRLVPHLIRSIMKHGYGVDLTNHPMDQIGTSSSVCGQESLAWLLTAHDIGIHRAAHV